MNLIMREKSRARELTPEVNRAFSAGAFRFLKSWGVAPGWR
jgi:hypothetical protein